MSIENFTMSFGEVYELLIKAIKEDRLDWFLEHRGEYTHPIFDRGVILGFDYSSSFYALQEYTRKYPQKKKMLQDKLLEILQTGTIITVRSFIELVHDELTFYPTNRQFTTEDILIELKKRVKEYEDKLNHMDMLDLQEYDNCAYRRSGIHFIYD